MAANYRKALIGQKKFEKKESWPELIKTANSENETSSDSPQPGQSQDAIQDRPPKEKKLTKNELSKKNEKKKFKKPSSQINIDLFQAIQNALEAKKLVKTKGIKKRTKLVEKGGNRLDSDRPILHKGKVRMKKKKPTVTKRCFLLVRNLPKNKLPFSPSLSNLKMEIARLESVDVDKLSQTFEKVKIDKIPESETINRGEISVSRITSDVVHTNKFKGYCRNCVSAELKESVRQLIMMLRKFQDKLHARDEIKAHAKRRYVCGIKESKKFVLCGKVKCLIVATNLEMDEGLPSYEIMENLIDAAASKDVPVIYASLSKELGYWTLKKRKISVVAILDYDGANDAFKQMITHWEKAKADNVNLMKTTNDFLVSKQDTVKADIEGEIRDQMISKLTEEQQ